jgi:hypothetical protein
MRILDKPKLSVRRVAADLVIIAMEASTGEVVGAEVDDATAAEWSETIASTGDAPESN